MIFQPRNLPQGGAENSPASQTHLIVKLPKPLFFDVHFGADRQKRPAGKRVRGAKKGWYCVKVAIWEL